MGGGRTPLYDSYFTSELVLQDTKNDFLLVLSKLSQMSLVKIFHMSGWWFPKWFSAHTTDALHKGQNYTL